MNDGELFAADADEARIAVAAAALKKAEALADLRKREADYTSRPNARAHLAAGWLTTFPMYQQVKGWHIGQGSSGITRDVDDGIVGAPGPRVSGPLRVLDLGAGAGVWSGEMLRRAVLEGWDVHITAVELDPKERKWLERVAHVVIIGDWHLAFGMVQTDAGVWVDGPGPRPVYDIVIGNPPFSEARAQVRPAWGPKWAPATASVRRMLVAAEVHDLVAAGWEPGIDTTMVAKAQAQYDPETSMVAVSLRHAHAAYFYMSQQSWTKTGAGWLTRLAYPPAEIYDVAGSVSHREGGGGDSISYSGSLWIRGHKGPAQTRLIRPFAGRSWKVRPGTESAAWCRANRVPLLTE